MLQYYSQELEAEPPQSRETDIDYLRVQGTYKQLPYLSRTILLF